jgi:hypothetical protein
MKRLLLLLFALFVILQFLPIQTPGKVEETPKEYDFLEMEPLSTAEKTWIRAACYDCHSNDTNMPWYAYVAPVSWSIRGHIRHGRGDMNLSLWGSLSPHERNEYLEVMIKDIKRKKMPLSSYLRMHPEAQLSEPEWEQLCRALERLRTRGKG